MRGQPLSYTQQFLFVLSFNVAPYFQLKNWSFLFNQFKNYTFECRGINKDEWVNFVMPNGLHDEEGLHYFSTRYFKSSLDRCPISTSFNLATIKFVIILKRKYKFWFNSDLCFIFGFENEAELSSKYNESAKVPNATRNSDRIHIHCSLVDRSIVNGIRTSDVIWTFAPKTEPGTLLCKIPIEREKSSNRLKRIHQRATMTIYKV